MRTIVNKAYNQLSKIHVEDRELSLLKPDEVQIKVYAASLNKADLFLAKGKPFMIRLMYGLLKPKNIIPGSDFSGQVIAVGNQVTRFKKGDKVFGDLSAAGFGAFAEIVNVPQKMIWFMPVKINYQEAAALPMAFATALEALNQINDVKGKRVLIYGGSGGVGRFLVHLALYRGALVDVVAGKSHIKDLQSLGVSEIFDYQNPSFSLPEKRYDILFAVNGYQPLRVYKKVLVKNGFCIIIGGSGKQLFAAMTKGWYYRLFHKIKVSTVLAKPGQEILKAMTDICDQTTVNVQIGKIYAFDEVSQAYLDFDKHLYTGKYVIDMTL